MSSIASKFGHKAMSLPKKSSFFTDTRQIGIEIEQEYETRPSHEHVLKAYNEGKLAHWNIKRDGSLRNQGIEFVSKILYPHEVDKALADAMPLVRGGNFSWRCAIHVHVDARDLSDQELRGVGATYAILEPLIFRWEGHERDMSRFCVPWSLTPDGVEQLYSAIEEKSNAGTIENALVKFGKYSACNLLPLASFGSIEFRHMQTIDSIEKIKQYVDLCLAIVEVGSSGIDPAMEMSSLGPRHFIEQTFKGRADMLFNADEDYNLLWEGINVANGILCATSNPYKSRVKDQMGSSYPDLIRKKLKV